MKIKTTTEVDIDIKVFVDHLSGSTDQAEFFNCLAVKFNGFADGDKDGMQMLYIKDELTEAAKQFIAKLNDYVNE